MLKSIARILLLRVLPRRLLPIVTIAQAFLLLRSIRNRSRTRVNAPGASRTAPPVTAASDTPASRSRRD